MPDGLRELRRGQVIAAARALVARDGIEGLTIGALEKSLRFSRGVITYHFADKDEIVDAVLDSALAEIDAATSHEVAESHSLEEKVRAVLRTKVHGFLGHVEAARIQLSFWGRLGVDRRIREKNARLYAGYRAQAAALVRASGADVDEAAVAALLVGTVIGIATQALFEPGSVDPDAAIEEATALFVARLGGAATSPGAPSRPRPRARSRAAERRARSGPPPRPSGPPGTS